MKEERFPKRLVHLEELKPEADRTVMRLHRCDTHISFFTFNLPLFLLVLSAETRVFIALPHRAGPGSFVHVALSVLPSFHDFHVFHVFHIFHVFHVCPSVACFGFCTAALVLTFHTQLLLSAPYKTWEKSGSPPLGHMFPGRQPVWM